MHGPKANWSKMKCFQPVTHPITAFMAAPVVPTNGHAFLEAVLPSKSAFWPVITTMANSSSPERRAVLSPPGTQSYEEVTTCHVGRLRLTEAWGPAQSHTAHWFRTWSLNTEVLRFAPFLLHFSSFITVPRAQRKRFQKDLLYSFWPVLGGTLKAVVYTPAVKCGGESSVSRPPLSGPTRNQGLSSASPCV